MNLSSQIMEILKDISAILGVILSAGTVVTLASKRVKGMISNIFSKYGSEKEMSKLTGEIAALKQLMSDHVSDGEKFKKKIEEMNDISLEFTKTQCKNMIKSIFYKYNDTKVLPLYEKKTLMSIEDLYVNKLHCNHFGLLLLQEMSTWEVDYDSIHPYDVDDK